MITLEGRVISEGITPTFLTGLAAVFAIYMLNLQYQEEAACTPQFIQRHSIGINPEKGTKATRGKVTSKRTGAIVQKNAHISTLLKNLIDFQWDFIQRYQLEYLRRQHAARSSWLSGCKMTKSFT